MPRFLVSPTSAPILFFASTLLCGCGPRFFRSLEAITAGDHGAIASLAVSTVQITDSSPTANDPLSLTYGLLPDPYAEYCIQENNSVVTSCAWVAGTLPSSYSTTATDGPVVLSVWLRSADGTVSGRMDSNAIVLDRDAPTLNLTSHAGGGVLAGGAVSTIAWTGSDDNEGANPISIEYSANSGATWNTIATGEANDGSYDWTVPVVTSTAYRVRVTLTDEAGNSTTVASGGDFSINSEAPILASATVSNASPTSTQTYALTYGAVTNPYAQYCILENDTVVANCSWQNGALPASFSVSATEGPKTLSVWLKNASNQVSARVDSNTVALRLTAIVANWNLENHLTNDLVFSPQLNKAGKVYYVVYANSGATLTATQVQGCATGSDAGCPPPLKSGTITLPTPNTPVPTTISGLANYGLYRLHAVAEDAAGLAPNADVKKYSAVLPKKISYESYATAIAGKNSSTMRYEIIPPVGYYQASTPWPVLIYVSVSVNGDNNSLSGFETAALTSGLAGRIRTGIDNFPLVQATLTCTTKQTDGSFLFDCGAGTNKPYHNTNLYGEFIDKLVATYNIDPDRIYIAGSSAAGGTVWKLITAYPEKIAAAVPMSISNIGTTPGFAFPTGATLCNAVAGSNQIAIWSIIHASDSFFTDTASVTTVTNAVKACSGYNADARITILTGTSAAYYPSSVNAHLTKELIFNIPFWNNAGAVQTGGTKWYKANGTAAGTADTNPIPSTRVPLHPGFVSDLSTASTELGATLNSIVDWMLQWEKP